MTRDGPRSADRLIDLLDLMSQDRSGHTLSQLSAALETPKASLFALLGTLTRREMLVRDETGRYQLGPAAMRIAMNIAASRSFTEITHPLLVKLARKVGETVLIGCYEPQAQKAVYVDKAESDSAVRYTVPLGMTRDLHCSSVGKVILAFHPDAAQKALKQSRLKRHTDATVTDRKALLAELEQVRANRLAETVDEATFGASGLSTPIFSRDGVFVAGLVVAGPTQRVRPVAERIARDLHIAAQALTLALPETTSHQISLVMEDARRRRA